MRYNNWKESWVPVLVWLAVLEWLAFSAGLFSGWLLWGR